MAGIEAGIEGDKHPDERIGLRIEVEIMRAAGLTDEEIARLALFKQRVDAGQVDDLTLEHKRLHFLKHLYDNHRILR